MNFPHHMSIIWQLFGIWFNINFRNYSTNKDEDDGQGPAKRSKWKHFKPDPGPQRQAGVKIGPPPGLL